ncbi:MAG: hypothetical protein Q9164_001884 [Protoblastenia rupestris]
MSRPPLKAERSVGRSTDAQPSAADVSHTFVRRHGRRYLREVPNYPLPVDLVELHRQTLRTTLLTEVFGTPYCAKFHRPPERILETICGPAVWSLQCDQYLKKLGYHNVSFTGLDVARLAPDLRRYGVNWRFVQHDLRKPPMPFGEGYFDLILVNDGTTVMPSGRDVKTNPLSALKRYLRPGGVVEVLESDYVFRCLQPEPARAPGTATEHAKQAEKTATYTVGPATPFSPAQNPYLADYNKWIEKALRDRGVTVTPCAVMGFGLSAEAYGYEEVGSRRIAIPFSTIRWETDVEAEAWTDGKTDESSSDGKQLGKGKGLTKPSGPLKECRALTPNQLALRRTALTVAVGLIESLEPLLMEESGKKQDEWDRWWGSMMADLHENNGTLNGECLEVGVWWARKALI